MNQAGYGFLGKYYQDGESMSNPLCLFVLLIILTLQLINLEDQCNLTGKT